MPLPGSLLPRDFFLPSPEIVARGLLGKLLVRRLGGRILSGRVVETEAYFGFDDPAAHSHSGRTPRNSVLFGPPGHAYVYFIYGMHQCLNVSCEPEGAAGCVLLRALEPLEGLAAMAANRGLQPEAPSRLLASGPGRLCQALAITRSEFNDADMTSAASELQLREDAFPPPTVLATARIGITKAADRLLRFYIAGNRFVSGKASARG